MDDEVGLLAGLDRTDSVGHADRLGTGDRRQLERLVGAEPFGVDAAIAGDAGCHGGSAQDVGRVAGVRRVAPERDAAAALDDVGVASAPACTPCPSRRYAHGQYAIAVRDDSTSSISDSSNHTPWASSRCGPSTPRWSRCTTGRRPVRAR